jgi:hypothetical protein
MRRRKLLVALAVAVLTVVGIWCLRCVASGEPDHTGELRPSSRWYEPSGSHSDSWATG